MCDYFYPSKAVNIDQTIKQVRSMMQDLKDLAIPVSYDAIRNVLCIEWDAMQSDCTASLLHTIEKLNAMEKELVFDAYLQPMTYFDLEAKYGARYYKQKKAILWHIALMVQGLLKYS